MTQYQMTAADMVAADRDYLLDRVSTAADFGDEDDTDADLAECYRENAAAQWRLANEESDGFGIEYQFGPDMCVYCDNEVTENHCYTCNEYKGIVDWDTYTRMGH